MKFGLTLKGENHWRIQKEKAKSGYLGISKNLGSLGCATGAGLDWDSSRERAACLGTQRTRIYVSHQTPLREKIAGEPTERKLNRDT